MFRSYFLCKSFESCFLSSNVSLSFSLIFASLRIHDLGVETMTLDKSWIDAPKFSMVYMNGIASFIEYATKNSTNNQNIYFPCKKCYNRFLLRPKVVHNHLRLYCFVKWYKRWIFHGKTSASIFSSNSPNMASHTRSLNDIDVDLGTRDLIMEVIGLNVPVHDRDEFSHGDHVNGGGDVVSTLLPSEDVGRTTGEILWMIARVRMQMLHHVKNMGSRDGLQVQLKEMKI
ncbi:uncharacterized protein LOC128043120 [Gossypium raimondii]|uniref:uncharacterized protein LOC128043120 n=1 Tax=Gossypium raimondii TaxID=29730 RepID=UPI00227B76B1|nr:uncharacterized protein LOC128043120 [Gossypium raimondii]